MDEHQGWTVAWGVEVEPRARLWVRRVFAVLLIGMVAVACSAPALRATVSVRCCDTAVVSPKELASQLRAKCPTDAGGVAFELTITKVNRSFSCAGVRQPATEVEAMLVESVSDRNAATFRADRIISLWHVLGVEAEFTHSDLVWDLATTVSDDKCEHAGDLPFLRDEIAIAHTAGENATHWFKVEAGYVAGSCPARINTLYTTVIALGQPQAVAEVRAQLAGQHLG
jgi:hypothetical protein